MPMCLHWITRSDCKRNELPAFCGISSKKWEVQESLKNYLINAFAPLDKSGGANLLLLSSIHSANKNGSLATKSLFCLVLLTSCVSKLTI